LKPITWVIARGIQKASSMQVSKLKSRNTPASTNFVVSGNNGTTDSILVGVLSAPVWSIYVHSRPAYEPFLASFLIQNLLEQSWT
jgi:hypothetical protein